MADINKTYTVPGEIALAAMTGRTQFITTLINKTDKDNQLSVETQIELLHMLKDLLEDQQTQHKHLAEMKKLLRAFDDFSSGLDKKTEELRQLIKKAQELRDGDGDEQGEDEDGSV